MKTQVSGTLVTHTVLFSGDQLDLVVDGTALSRQVLNDAASRFQCMRWAVARRWVRLSVPSLRFSATRTDSLCSKEHGGKSH